MLTREELRTMHESKERTEQYFVDVKEELRLYRVRWESRTWWKASIDQLEILHKEALEVGACSIAVEIKELCDSLCVTLASSGESPTPSDMEKKREEARTWGEQFTNLQEAISTCTAQGIDSYYPFESHALQAKAELLARRVPGGSKTSADMLIAVLKDMMQELFGTVTDDALADLEHAYTRCAKAASAFEWMRNRRKSLSPDTKIGLLRSCMACQRLLMQLRVVRENDPEAISFGHDLQREQDLLINPKNTLSQKITQTALYERAQQLESALLRAQEEIRISKVFED